MLCNECLGGDKARDSSSNYHSILKTTLVLLDVACMSSLVYSSHVCNARWLDIANVVKDNETDAERSIYVNSSNYEKCP